MIPFVEFAASHGLLIAEPFTDGRIHRVSTDDDEPNKDLSVQFSSPPPYRRHGLWQVLGENSRAREKWVVGGAMCVPRLGEGTPCVLVVFY